MKRVALHGDYLLVETNVNVNGIYTNTELYMLNTKTRSISEYPSASDAFEQSGMPKETLPNWVLPWTLPKPKPLSYF